MKCVVIFAVLFMVVCVEAQVVIEQVYPNPVGSESGGEAVLLRNYDSALVVLDGWVLATEASARDVVLKNITILPGAAFLVADFGWDEKKDDSEWRSADLIETFTLGNADSGVALVDVDGKVVDAVGWGSEDVLVSGVPVSNPVEGKALVRKGRSGNNHDDFVVAEPELDSSDVLVVILEVGRGGVRIVNVSIISDSSADDGIQVRVGVPLVVRAVVDGDFVGELTARIGNQSVVLDVVNGSVYEGQLVLDAKLQAGLYDVIVSDGASEAKIVVEYVEEKRFVLAQQKVVVHARAGRRGSAVFDVVNAGNVPVVLRPVLAGNVSVGRVLVSIDGVEFVFPDVLRVSLGVGERRQVLVAVDVGNGVSAGTYKVKLKWVEVV